MDLTLKSHGVGAFSSTSDDPRPLHQFVLADLASAWPELCELRRAASAPGIYRFTGAVTALISEARVTFAAALVASRKRLLSPTAADDASLAATVLRGQLRFEAALHLATLDQDAFASWHLPEADLTFLLIQLRQLVATGPGLQKCATPHLPGVVEFHDWFPHVSGYFLAALAGGWPWNLALQAFQHLSLGHFLHEDLVFAAAVPLESGSPNWLCSQLSLPCTDFSVQFFLNNGFISLITASRPLRYCTPLQRAKILVTPSNIPRVAFPDFLKLPIDDSTGGILMPLTKVTDVVERRRVWHSRLGPLDGATAAIVDGHFIYPRQSWGCEPSFLHNHPSWEGNKEAKQALGPTIATWIHSGILEWVSPTCPPPLVVEPLGAVAKNTPPYWRLISDARRSNLGVGEWPVRFMNALEMASALRYGAMACADDAHDAYHLSAFAGCTGKLFVSPGLVCTPDGSWKEEPRLHLGCTPSTCLGACDKARSGCCIDGHYFRFAAAHFGQKLAGSPLNNLFRAIIRYLVRLHMKPEAAFLLLCFLWVDDLSLARNIEYHGFCGGLENNCSTCIDALHSFKATQALWHRLAAELGITLNLTKRQEPSQRFEYTGILFDTIRGRLFIPEKKLDKLTTCLRDLAAASETTLRNVLSVQGRVRHYSLCIPYIGPLVPLLCLHTLNPSNLDVKVPVPRAIRDTCHTILELIYRFAPTGSALWPFVPSSLYGAFLRGETAGAHIAVLAWDSSPIGWGLVIRTHELPNGRLIVGTWAPHQFSDAQVHRETLGGCLSLEAASSVVDLHGATIIFRNDAVGALAALRKGNSQSPVLQDLAVRLSLKCAALEVQPLFLHAPGKDLVAEGIDGASRDLASNIAGPACSTALRGLLFNVAAELSWTITVDAFASECNRLVPRFFSEFAEPGAEAVDALSVTDWDTSICPFCSMHHRETLFAFPPRFLLRRFIAKALADRARALVLVPFSITSAYWPALMTVALPIRGQSYLRIRNLRTMLTHSHDFPCIELALFAIDFARYPSTKSVVTTPGCGQESAWRGRSPLGHPSDCEDRRRIRDELELRLRLSNGSREAPTLSSL